VLVEMRRLLEALKRPKFWLIVAWILLPFNTVSVILYTSLPAILALCVNVVVVTAQMWGRLRP
jgi:Na+/H+ antiporter NhaC